jgi:anthranilate phosphoribosyltransferase
LSTAGISKVSEWTGRDVRDFEVDPEDYGLKLCKMDALAGGSADENAVITRSILSGEKGPRRDVVLLNAAAGLVVAGFASDLGEGVELAAESIDSGRALEKLETLVKYSGENA